MIELILLFLYFQESLDLQLEGERKHFFLLMQIKFIKTHKRVF